MALAVLLLLVVLITRPRVAVGVSAIAGCRCGWVLCSCGSAGPRCWSGSTEGQDAARLPIYQDTLDMIAARPWTGHGYGTYEQSFRLYQDRSAGPLLVDKAHNTYLEHAAELGIPATVLLYLGPAHPLPLLPARSVRAAEGQDLPAAGGLRHRAGGGAFAGRFQPPDSGGGGSLRRDPGDGGSARAYPRRETAGLGRRCGSVRSGSREP